MIRNRFLRGALIAFAIGDVVPATVLALTFHPILAHRRSVVLARVACLVALAALGVVFALRRQLEALLDRLDARVRAAATARPDMPGETPLRSGATLAGVAFFFAVVSVALAVTSTPAFQRFIAEDGIIEYGSSLSWFGAAACALAALRLDRRQLRTKLAFYLPLIAIWVLAGGEEISWGQRLLHFQTPVALAANKQHEANLHDIGSISVSENAFFVFTTVCCLVVPWLLARAPAWRVYLRRLNAPIVDPFVARLYGIGLAAWLIVGVRFGTLGFSPLSLWGHYSQSDDEIWEFFAAFSFFALAALDLAHRLREQRRERLVILTRAPAVARWRDGDAAREMQRAG